MHNNQFELPKRSAAAFAEIGAQARGANRGKLEESLKAAASDLLNYKKKYKKDWNSFKALVSKVYQIDEKGDPKSSADYEILKAYASHPAYEIYQSVNRLHTELLVAIEAASTFDLKHTPISHDLDSRVKTALR